MRRNIKSGAPVKRLPLPVGNSDWAAVTEGYWSADKTQLISGLLDKKTTVALFTRPRRFGKTFALRMLRTFFEKTQKSNAHLFKNTKVWRDTAHRAEQGRYPVVYVTLKDAKAGSWELMKAFIRAAVAEEFRRHDAVFASRKCDRGFKTASESMRMRTADDETITASLGILAEAVHAHYGEKPVILIDEYDSPINYAATHGFGEECLQFFRNFLSGAMKDGKHCRLGVMTGILRMARDAYLNGELNEDLNSIFDCCFADCFGLTEVEVRSLLKAYGRIDKFDEARAWYGGYFAGENELFNPGSLLEYVKNGFTAQAFRDDEADDVVVDAIKSKLTPSAIGDLSEIVNDGSAFVRYDSYPDGAAIANRNPDSAFTLSVHAGYLRARGGQQFGYGHVDCPNAERKEFWKSVLKR
jgi:hypothetical protein